MYVGKFCSVQLFYISGQLNVLATLGLFVRRFTLTTTMVSGPQSFHTTYSETRGIRGYTSVGIYISGSNNIYSKEQGTQQTHNVAGTSLQRRCNVLTLRRRCNDIVATVCVYWALMVL